MKSPDYLTVTRAMIGQAAAAGVPLFVVGGVVRDLMLSRSVIDFDLDVVVEGDALEFAGTLAATLGGSLRTFPDFLTAKICAPAAAPGVHEIDLASARTERYGKPGALPTVAAAPMSEDLRRRDFTINAMALPLEIFVDYLESGGESFESVSRALVDPFGGREDLERRLIRTLHRRSFLDDPTRLFRACRYAARIGAALEPETAADAREAIREGAPSTVSMVRVANELVKIMSEPAPGAALAMARSIGLLNALGPCGLTLETEAGSDLDRLAAAAPRLAGGARSEIRRLVHFVLIRAGGDRPDEPMSRRLCLSKKESRELEQLAHTIDQPLCADTDAALLIRAIFGPSVEPASAAVQRGLLRG